MKAVFLDAEGLEQFDLTGLRAVCDTLDIYPMSQPEEVEKRVGDAELIIVNKVRIERELLERSGNLKLITVAATGTDCVDLDACREFGVTVTNCRAYGTDSVGQHVFTMILALSTNLIRYNEAVQAGRWQKAQQFCFLDFPIKELSGKTLGIVGFGTLGKGVAKIAKAFGLNVVVSARPGAADDSRPPLSEILPTLDILTLHCPLTPETRGLVGRDELAAMKPTAFLINAARGGIVDETALAEALQKGEIGGAAVDVLSTEPPAEGNPLLVNDLPNLIVTPHIAWASEEARQRILEQTAENIASFKTGKPVRVVTAP